MRRFGMIGLLMFSVAVCAEAAVDEVRVFKQQRILQLLSGGQVSHQFAISLGFNPLGHKQQEGDGRTPEGRYLLDYKNNQSGYHKSLHISYPNANDRSSAAQRGVAPGGDVMLHGQRNGWGWLGFITRFFDWTLGCIALSDADIDVIWAHVEVGTPIEILP